MIEPSDDIQERIRALRGENVMLTNVIQVAQHLVAMGELDEANRVLTNAITWLLQHPPRK